MSFLAEIVSARRRWVEAARGKDPHPDTTGAPPVRDFAAALDRPGIGIIAEFKRSSPSKGPLHPGADPVVFARAYEAGGARAMSVLVEPDFFGGSASDLTAVRRSSGLPVLWKDFVLDDYQVRFARSAGADAVLLIVRILDPQKLVSLMGAIRALGMTPVLEVFDRNDAARAMALHPEVVGINQRDLETFAEDPGAVAALAPLIRGPVVCGFSAVSTREQVVAMEAAGVRAVLVGEALMRAQDPAAAVRELTGA